MFPTQGEQHGFRKSENIIATLEGEFCFFAKVFGYEPADFECTVCAVVFLLYKFVVWLCIMCV